MITNRVIPIPIKQANSFVIANHRHHGKTAGCKFALGLTNGNGELIGVAICGRPVSRFLDDGLTLEINRLCTDGTKNSCSMLYGACIKVAKAMGYKKVITYTLEPENGASLKASNFKNDGLAGGTVWTGKRSGRDNGVPKELKRRWVYTFT